MIANRTVKYMWVCAQMLGLCGIFLALVQSAAAITITRTSGAVVYTDIPKGLACSYASYAISNESASVYYSNVWVKVDSFVGSYVKLGGGDPGIYGLDDLAPGQMKMVFVYLQTTNTTTTPQSHTVRIYNAYPGAGGTELTNSTFSVTVKPTLENNSSKVNSVTYTPASPSIGGLITITVLGDCGQVQNNDIVDFTPAAFTNWNAAAFQMLGVSLILTNKTATASTNLSNFLELPPALSPWGGGNITYGAFYTFRAVAVTVSNTPVSPITYASQGQSSSHTITTGYGSFAPIQTPTNTTVLSKLASVTQLYTNELVTYTVRLANSGPNGTTVDRVVDTLPPGMSYVMDSSKFNGVTILNPTIVGSVLTWSEIYSNPAYSSRDLTFQTTPATAGYATNSVIAYAGSSLIDTTYPTSDSVPGTNVVRVLLPPTAVTDTGAVLEEAVLTVAAPGLLSNDLEPNGFPISIVSYSQPAHGTVTVNANGSYSYTPTADYYGSDSFTYTITNNNARTATGTVNITVTPVNDAPSFAKGANQTVLMNAGAQTVTGWATSISTGPANEASQTVAFHLSSDNASLFSVQPAIAPNGTLTYTPAANASGVATVTVYVQDDGGTANGGIDTSATQTFTIQITAYSIGNRVFEDWNNDGKRDFGENGISGVQMRLFGADGSGNPTGSVLKSTSTDANGDYRFDSVAAGSYVVVVD